jgi:hypothetical protein
MKMYKICSAVVAVTVAVGMTIQASAAQELSATDAVHKFDLGTDSVGGSGVEADEGTVGSNWVKVVQSSNPQLKLFEDVGTDVNVTALAVTFEISDWSGIEFPVSWGANIDFINDSNTTWCGTSAFSGISEYTISGDGEYTLVCDLAAMTQAQGKEGIAHMQTCEMVIGDVPEGDTTQIEVKSARIYTDGETAENAVLPGDNSVDSTDTGDNSSDDENNGGDTADSGDDSDNAGDSSEDGTDTDTDTDTDTNTDTDAETDSDTSADSDSDSEDGDSSVSDSSSAADSESGNSDSVANSSGTAVSGNSAGNTVSDSGSAGSAAVSGSGSVTSGNTIVKASDGTVSDSTESSDTGAGESLAFSAVALAACAIIVSKKK